MRLSILLHSPHLQRFPGIFSAGVFYIERGFCVYKKPPP
ncbi:hypothetical protein B4099_2176 [Heyndrickxia coagulans]|uniref:Uncharacterized protein n=1 Tax=Heyndrickxia coagulans TaxID=1398 RepID=A0A150KEM2_HEYCO|nr:hypothetical protein B4099_2176 [Heyndrickxia coagulans]